MARFSAQGTASRIRRIARLTVAILGAVNHPTVLSSASTTDSSSLLSTRTGLPSHRRKRAATEASSHLASTLINFVTPALTMRAQGEIPVPLYAEMSSRVVLKLLEGYRRLETNK